jgi:hypothetical protein
VAGLILTTLCAVWLVTRRRWRRWHPLDLTGPSPFASGSDDQGGGWRLYHRVHVVERLANHVALLAGGACLAAAVASVLG